MPVRLSKEKTYEQLMEEALLKIPLYDKSWTNFNKSDPGITILENLCAFTILQQGYINQETDDIKEALLKAAGFTRREGMCARVLLSVKNVKNSFRLPANRKFVVGDMVFENERAVNVSKGKIMGIFLYDNKGGITEYPELLKEEPRYPSMVFTKKPLKGMEIWFYMDGMPEDEEELVYYIKTFNEFGRNPRGDSIYTDELFAKIRWQCYTESGFQDMRVKDETGCFIFDGRITFSLKDIKPSVYYGKESGYVIRGILEKAEYDIAPGIFMVSGFLFEVVQRETKSLVRVYENTDTISIYSDILEQEYFRLYVKEEGGGYRACEDEDYTVCHEACAAFTFQLKKKRERIMLAVYTEEMMKNYSLGTVYGYDGETIELPVKKVAAEGFSIIAGKHGRYYLMKPDIINEGGFSYTVDGEQGMLKIIEAGRFAGAGLYIGGLAVSEGDRGNIPALKQFFPTGYDSDVKFVNPVPGFGGRGKETVADLSLRFLKDVNSVHIPVAACDYESIVKSIPGLCIDKVKAYRKAGDQSVHVVVKPKYRQGLTGKYRKIINRVLENKRLLGTVFQLENPVYLLVNVKGEIYVKGNYTSVKSIISNEIRKHLDYVHSDKNFGELLEFNKVFEAVERLECVETVRNLLIRPENLSRAVMEGADIRPADNCLIYPGDIRIEIDYIS